VISLTIARKYARAFLGIGQKEGHLEPLGRELDIFNTLLRGNKELRAILFSPFYKPAQRKEIARLAGESLGLSKVSLDLIGLLIERNRMDHFPAIVQAYEGLCDEASNRVRASLVSAEKLSSPLMSEMKKQLESTTGKEVLLSVKEEPSLIGGVVTRIGNIIYDGSLKTQLLKAKENLYKE